MANLTKINLNGEEHSLGITEVATTAANGLMSAADKTKLDGVDAQIAAKVSADQVQVIINNNTNDFATESEVATAITNGTKNFITSADAQTMVNNATSGLVTTSAMNTAISNATSDKITSSQAQTIANNAVASYKLKGDFAVINGSMTLAANTQANLDLGASQQTMINIDFPSGFNKDNCVCLAFGVKGVENRNYAYGYNSSGSLGMLRGTVERTITLGALADATKIGVEAYNMATSEKTLWYRIVLMKI